MIRLFFGSPGCGKTTLAVKQLYDFQYVPKFKARKVCAPYDYCFSNFENNISNYLDCSNLGLVCPPPFSYIAIDEGGIVFNNRDYKNFPKHCIEFFKLHRHYKCDIDVFSQSWEDVDITIRRLADELWYVRRVGPFTMVRRVYKTVGIDKNTEQIIDKYRFPNALFSLMRSFPLFKLLPIPLYKKDLYFFLRAPYYQYFDSYSVPSNSNYLKNIKKGDKIEKSAKFSLLCYICVSFKSKISQKLKKDDETNTE